MDISRLCKAATLLPLTTLANNCEKAIACRFITEQARLNPKPHDVDMRRLSRESPLPDLTPSAAPQPLATESNWEKTRDTDGIRIYTRLDPGKPFQRMRGEFETTSTAENALQALMDPDHFIDWLDGMQEITISDRRENDKAFTLNAVSKEANLLLFTIPAREVSIRCERHNMPNDGSTCLTMKMLPPPPTQNKNRIRADAFDGEVVITPKAAGKVGISFNCYFEPGGSLPAWAVNSVSAGSVFKSMQNARQRITELFNKPKE
jgi:hypothetical protein